MKRLAIALLLILPSFGLKAFPTEAWGELFLGMEIKSFKSLLKGTDSELEEANYFKKQGMSKAFLRSELLLYLNKVKKGEMLLKQWQASQVLLVKRGSFSAVFLFVSKKLSAVLMVEDLNISSKDPFDPYRLKSIRAYINKHKKSCNLSALKPVEKNPKVFGGPCNQREQLYLQYKPESDKVYRLIYSLK